MSGIRIIRDFFSQPENTVRTVRICTPDAYEREPGRRFPVLYMLDGQNVLNHPESAIYHTWCANTTMDRLTGEGAMAPWIIVGIDHGLDRFSEYSPWWEPAVGAGGGGWMFIDFLANHLKPYIDENYRTLSEPHWTAVMGASLGGLMSLAMGKSHPRVFGRIGAVSPTVMWANGEIFRLWDRPTGRWCRLYMDVGSLERYWFHDIFLDYVEATRHFLEHLKRIGVADHELRYVVAPDHFHNEEAWQARLPDIFRWLLEDPKGI
ncbi:MAG: alpha/beta hydrolase-fold protein [Syntrophobacteraceae bacterium]|jgi:predicted alpha/beta superfamily hydrolase|nr:alpha/beta hydrolase-fold protein [Syntrophobacteraceae bacterium]